MCSVKNRLALLFFAVLLAAPMAVAQRRRPSAPPLPQAPDDGCSLKTLAAGTYSSDVEIDDRYVYFNDSGTGIFRVSKGGGTPELLALLPDNFITTMAIDDSTVYALTTNDGLEFGSVWSVSKTGGTPRMLAGNILTPYEIATDANHVYWVSLGTPTDNGFLADGKLFRVNKDGSGLTTMASNLTVPTSVASDGTNVYFTESGLSLVSNSRGLRSIPVNGGQVHALTNDTPTVSVIVSGSDLYFSIIDVIKGGAVLRVPKSGGSTKTLASGLDAIVHMAVSGDRLYFFNTDDFQSIQWVPLTGGTPKHAIDGEFAAEEFAVDDCALFWVNGNGDLIRTPK